MSPINAVAEAGQGSVVQEQGDSVVVVVVLMARNGLLGVFLSTQALRHRMNCHSGEFAEAAFLLSVSGHV